MWLYMIAGFLFLLGVVGGVASGGIFTLIFIPLGFVMLVVAAGVGWWGRSAQADAEGSNPTQSAEPKPLPSSPPHETPRPSTPEELVDARRTAQ
jgi:hypothetical protein